MSNIDKQALRWKAEKATQGEWWSDSCGNEGTYGSGDDCVEGFTSYAVYDENNQILLDTLNSTAACINEEYDGEGHVAWDEVGQRNAEFVAAANPATVLALLDELEVATDACNGWQIKFAEADERLEAAEKLIADSKAAQQTAIEYTAGIENQLEDALARIVELEARDINIKQQAQALFEAIANPSDHYVPAYVRCLREALNGTGTAKGE
ncbi:ead/Ea22-like family protein [Enterobacter ludwigii]|uniref:ead/Ea22-like family protein n=1 Tax=Enterobacter ludwigii TaxID=299767 RepID=UPI0038766702